jgi:hypothetical protein
MEEKGKIIFLQFHYTYRLQVTFLNFGNDANQKDKKK